MPWVTHPGDYSTPFETLQAYNMLDTSITAQLAVRLRAEMDDASQHVYARSLRVQALCLAMSAHGLPVDQAELAAAKAELQAELAKLNAIWTRFCDAVGAGFVNPQSPKQLHRLFYETLGLSVEYVYDPKKRARVASLNRKVLEERLSLYTIAHPFVRVLLAIRAATKMLGVLNVGLDGNILRCSFNPAGTETGRLSSNQNVFGGGTNAQNITPSLRRIVAARPKRRIAAVDLEQAESRAVAYLSGDEGYIRACESGDLHTTVTRMVWKDLPWTNDDARNREIAEQPFIRHYSYRDMSKRGGHGTNYYGKPLAIAKNMEVGRDLIEAFQRDYFNSFPGIREWQLRTIAEIQQYRKLTTPLKRTRCFWGRPDDPATHREAIAFVPQSLVGDIMNEALIEVGRWLKRERIDCSIIAQVHDAGVFDLREEDEGWLLPELARRLIYPVEVLGRTLIIPVEVKVGWNWAPISNTNPGGLVKWKPGFNETRTRRSARERFLDIRL